MRGPAQRQCGKPHGSVSQPVVTRWLGCPISREVGKLKNDQRQTAEKTPNATRVGFFHVENSCRTREDAGGSHICDGMQVCEGDDENDGDERNLEG